MEQQDLFALIVLLVWQCLCGPAYKNAQFSILFPSQDAVNEVLSAASVTFCPGLFEVLNASVPPTIDWFMNLPSAEETTGQTRWGLYVLVLLKAGARPLIYIGSGTDRNGGILARMSKWRALYKDSTSASVNAAVKDGYTIAHKGLLMWSPVPEGCFQLLHRLLYLALEATFTFIFWALKSSTATYGGMHIFCRWERDALTYGGLCSHSALLEKVNGDFNLTSEQLNEIEEARLQNRRAKNMRVYSKRKVEKPDAVKAARRKGDKARATNGRASKKFHCKPCNKYFSRQRDLDHHNGSDLIIRRHEKLLGRAKKPYCKICDQYFSRQTYLDAHNRSDIIAKKHKEILAAKAD